MDIGFYVSLDLGVREREGSRTFGSVHWAAPWVQIGKPGEEALRLLFGSSTGTFHLLPFVLMIPQHLRLNQKV